MERIAPDRFVRPPGPPVLADDEIHVWMLALDGMSDHKRVAAAAHALLGRLLCRYAGLARAPEIARSERGKPYAPTLPDLDFNLSHARDRALIAFARRQPLGVDLECIDRSIEAADLARRFFSAAEADALDALPEAARARAFLRLWTCKEAVLKAIGAGLTFGLDRIAFELDAQGEPAAIAGFAAAAGPRADWRIVRLEPATGFLGAVAWRGSPRRVLTFLADV